MWIGSPSDGEAIITLTRYRGQACAKCLTCTIPQDTPINLVRQTVVVPFYRWENRGSESLSQNQISRTRNQTLNWCDQLWRKGSAVCLWRHMSWEECFPHWQRREGLGYLQVDPLFQHPLLVELAEEARVGHTEGTACHLALATSHTTEDVVMQLTQDAWAPHQGHRACDLEGEWGTVRPWTDGLDPGQVTTGSPDQWTGHS